MRKTDWHLGKMGKTGVREKDCLRLRPDGNSRPGPSGHSRLRCSGDSIWGGAPGQGASRAQEDRVTGLRANPRVRAWLSASRGWRATGRALSLEPGLGGAPASGACRDEGGTHTKGTVLIPRAFRGLHTVLALRNGSITGWGRGGGVVRR